MGERDENQYTMKNFTAGFRLTFLRISRTIESKTILRRTEHRPRRDDALQQSSGILISVEKGVNNLCVQY